MKRITQLSFIVALAATVFFACATKPPGPASLPDPEPSAIQAEANGLEPGGEERFKKLSFALSVGSREAVQKWTVSIKGKSGVIFLLEGDKSSLPDSLSWNGQDTNGALGAEGSYTAILAIDYGEAFKAATVESKPFVLVTSPPSGKFSPNPALLSYTTKGPATPLEVTVTMQAGLAKAKDWNLDIYDANGDIFKSFTGAGSSGRIVWNGVGENGKAMTPADKFPALLTLRDEFGGTGQFTGSFAMADKPSAPPPAIAAKRKGFSPTSSSVKNSIDLGLSIPNKGDVLAWKVEINSAAKGVVRAFSGTAADLPEFVRWDGKDETGSFAAQGSYFSVLALDYGAKFKESTVRGSGFSLVMDAPAGSITVDPPDSTLSILGPKAPLRFTIQAKSAYAQIAKWTMSVIDQDGAALAFFQANWPNNKVEWDGKTVTGSTMKPATVYEAVAKVEDEYGNIGTLRGKISVDPLKPADEPSAISAAFTGFAPRGDGSRPTMDFTVLVGDRASLAGWKMELLGPEGSSILARSGTGTSVPGTLSWNGNKADGSIAPEGSYKARLSLDYGFAFAPVTVESKPFILALTPPRVALSVPGGLLSPDGDGQNETAKIGLTAAAGLGRIASWSVSILDPGANSFTSFKGAWPAAPIEWDGKSATGDLVESAADYEIVAKARDEFGNVGEAREKIGTDIMVVKTDDGYRIRIASIVFKPFTADYVDVPADRSQRNLATLDLLASKLRKFPDYRIALEGHAVMINWDDAKKGEAEQRSVLVPLSTARAEAIAAALVERGIVAERLVTRGLGAENPVVPDSDYANRWKNRRVDFLLLK